MHATNKSVLVRLNYSRELQLGFAKSFPQGVSLFALLTVRTFVTQRSQSHLYSLLTSLTKILSSSTPNFDIIGANGTEDGPQDEADVSCLPVTEYSWQEIARMVGRSWRWLWLNNIQENVNGIYQK